MDAHVMVAAGLKIAAGPGLAQQADDAGANAIDQARTAIGDGLYLAPPAEPASPPAAD